MKKRGQVKALAQVPMLLIQAGHECIEFSALHHEGPFERQKPYLWFWSLNLLFLRYDNRPISLKWSADEQKWYWRKNRGGWNRMDPVVDVTSNVEKWMAYELVRRLDNLMLGGNDEGDSEGVH